MKVIVLSAGLKIFVVCKEHKHLGLTGMNLDLNSVKTTINL